MRLYLNDSFVASVTAGADGRFAVTINEGVVSGSYRVRLDEVESNSGAVRARRGAVQSTFPARGYGIAVELQYRCSTGN